MKRVNKRVTDRAALQYLQNVYGLNVTALKKRIASKTHEGRSNGARSVISDGVRYSLADNGRVTHVVGKNGSMSKRALRWQRRRLKK